MNDINIDLKTSLIVAGAGIVTAAVATGITHVVRKHRALKPLPGTIKVEKLYVIKASKKK